MQYIKHGLLTILVSTVICQNMDQNSEELCFQREPLDRVTMVMRRMDCNNNDLPTVVRFLSQNQFDLSRLLGNAYTDEFIFSPTTENHLRQSARLSSVAGAGTTAISRQPATDVPLSTGRSMSWSSPDTTTNIPRFTTSRVSTTGIGSTSSATSKPLEQTHSIESYFRIGDDRCGPGFPAPNGEDARCDGNSDKPCCSQYNFCGLSNIHCLCSVCVDYRNV
ncbi:uncharacterized protein [Apostichopus japonicus]|uniref:uncharacterized protein n=1 Tax=Stichopus japonicus TaxID=307972 RepID=UPI003AB61AC8